MLPPDSLNFSGHQVSWSLEQAAWFSWFLWFLAADYMLPPDSLNFSGHQVSWSLEQSQSRMIFMIFVIFYQRMPDLHVAAWIHWSLEQPQGRVIFMIFMIFAIFYQRMPDLHVAAWIHWSLEQPQGRYHTRFEMIAQSTVHLQIPIVMWKFGKKECARLWCSFTPRALTADEGFEEKAAKQGRISRHRAELHLLKPRWILWEPPRLGSYKCLCWLWAWVMWI